MFLVVGVDVGGRRCQRRSRLAADVLSRRLPRSAAACPQNCRHAIGAGLTTLVSFLTRRPRGMPWSAAWSRAGLPPAMTAAGDGGRALCGRGASPRPEAGGRYQATSSRHGQTGIGASSQPPSPSRHSSMCVHDRIRDTGLGPLRRRAVGMTPVRAGGRTHSGARRRRSSSRRCGLLGHGPGSLPGSNAGCCDKSRPDGGPGSPRLVRVASSSPATPRCLEA